MGGGVGEVQEVRLALLAEFVHLFERLIGEGIGDVEVLFGRRDCFTRSASSADR